MMLVSLTLRVREHSGSGMIATEEQIHATKISVQPRHDNIFAAQGALKFRSLTAC